MARGDQRGAGTSAAAGRRVASAPRGASNLRGAALGLFCMALYAGHDAILKLLGGSYSPFQILFFAAVLSFPAATILLLSRRDGGSLRPAHPGWVALRSAALCLNAIACTAAFAVLPLAQVYAMLFTMPLMITVLAIPLLGERVGPHRWAAIALGLFGVLIVLRPGAGALSWGHAAALLGAAGGSLAAVIARRVGGEEKAIVLVLWPIVLNVLVTGAALPFVYRPMSGADLGLAGAVAMLALAAAAVNVMSYRTAEAAVVAPMQYSQIAWAAFYGWILFGELPDAMTILGLSVIAAAGVYILWREAGGNSRVSPVTTSDAAGDAQISPRTSFGPRVFPPRLTRLRIFPRRR